MTTKSGRGLQWRPVLLSDLSHAGVDAAAKTGRNNTSSSEAQMACGSVKPYYGVSGEEDVINEVISILANGPREVSELSSKLAHDFNRKIRQSPQTPLSTQKRNDGSFKKWLTQCGFVIGPLFGTPIKNRATVSLPEKYSESGATCTKAADDEQGLPLAEAALNAIADDEQGQRDESASNSPSRDLDGDSLANSCKDESVVETDEPADDDEPNPAEEAGTPEETDSGAEQVGQGSMASEVDEKEEIDEAAQALLEEVPQRECANDGAKAGRALLTLLKAGRSGQAPVFSSEPQPLSTDEFQLWAMQEREDKELGADVLNAETFGDDAGTGWSFEENLAAVEELAAVFKQRQYHFPGDVHHKSHAAFLHDTRDGAFERATVIWRRLQAAIQEVVHYVDIKPEYLKEALRYVVTESWERITWRRNFTALHLAAEHDRPDLMPLLVALRADLSAADWKGRTAIDISRKKGHLAAMHMLTRLQECQTFNDLLECVPGGTAGCCTASYWGGNSQEPEPEPRFAKFFGVALPMESAWTDEMVLELRRLNFVLHELVKLLHLPPDCTRALMSLASTGCSRTCLAAGGGVQLPMQATYTTPLHIATAYERDDVIPLLVTLRADPNATNSVGKTAMDVALEIGFSAAVPKLQQAVEGRFPNPLQRSSGDVLRLRAGHSTAGVPCSEVPMPSFLSARKEHHEDQMQSTNETHFRL